MSHQKNQEQDIRYAAGYGTTGTWGATLGADGIYWYNGTAWTAM